MVSQNPASLHPQTLLSELVRQQVSGCLQVSSGLTSWLLYLDQGRLAYATNSVMPFERLDRHLYRLSHYVPILGNALRAQVRFLYGRKPFHPHVNVHPDYQAILWLVDQKYLTTVQATQLVEKLTNEVLNAFLTLQEGFHEIIEKRCFDQFPQLCRVDLLPFLERQSGNSPTIPTQSIPTQTFPNQTFQTGVTHVENGGVNSETLGWDRSGIFRNSLAVAETSQPEIVPPAPPEPEPQTSEYKIVCVDDSPSILQAIRTYLDDQFTVQMINDPLKALIQIMRIKPDIVLLDVGMPNLDGYELCSMLRRHSHFRETPVIMVTGHTGFIDRARAKFVGASGYLTKPFTRPELIKMVFHHLPQR
jgi:two-component system, chemotaxis family, response regulator PixG